MRRATALVGAVLVVGTAAGAHRAAAAESSYVAHWAALLEEHTYVVPGTVGTAVDYRALQSEPAESRWRELLEQLASTPAPTTREATLALWINAYNILAIDTVLRAYPVDSIRELGSFLRPVWRHEAGTVAGRKVSLHEVEHEILRPLAEPRIHAAIVCASTSCPSLRRSPFSSSALGAELDEAMRSWLASPTKGLAIDRSGRTLRVSPIFDWFEEDFEAQGGVRDVLIRYGPESDRKWLSENARDAALTDLEYLDYDWRLNDWKPADRASTLRAR